MTNSNNNDLVQSFMQTVIKRHHTLKLGFFAAYAQQPLT